MGGGYGGCPAAFSPKGKGGKGGKDGGPPRKRFKGGGDGTPYPADGPTVNAEVRFDDTETAQRAADTLNGSQIGGATITVEMDPNSKDGTRIKVAGVPKGADWQEVKDHFGQIGRVAFADIKGRGKGNPLGLPVNGICRYEDPNNASLAVATFDGTSMDGYTI